MHSDVYALTWTTYALFWRVSQVN